MILDKGPCVVCGQMEVITSPSFSSLPRVTSDCRPFPRGGSLGWCAACNTVQKPADTNWLSEIAGIYSRYDMFRQAINHAEQAVFNQDTGNSTRRSALLLQRLGLIKPFTEKGRALDIGCGNGPMLRAISEIAPGWDLFGQEISDLTVSQLESIPGFRKLFVGDISAIDDSFNLITMSQSLEHLVDPIADMVVLRKKLSQGGLLLVQVPNVRVNTYDLIVADHRTHFECNTLEHCARNSGFQYYAIADDWVYKELTLVASDSPLEFRKESKELTPQTISDVEVQISWLSALIEQANAITRTVDSFGIFGTSIAATWLFGELKNQVKFFVDEDYSRIGQRHEDRPILAPGQVPSNSCVFVPLIPTIAKKVANRLLPLGIDVRIPWTQY